MLSRAYVAAGSALSASNTAMWVPLPLVERPSRPFSPLPAAHTLPPPVHTPPPISVHRWVPLPLLLERLLAEPFRRFSARTEATLAAKIRAALSATDKKAKKPKGGGGGAPPMTTAAAVRDAIAKADAGRPTFEAEWLAAHCIHAARGALPCAPPSWPGDEVEAPLEAVLSALDEALVQPTAGRASSPSPPS